MTPYKSQAGDKRQTARDRRRLHALPVSQFGEECYVATGGQRIRVNVRRGTGVPLVLCNGIGASLEVLDPFVDQLDPDTTVVRFDVPGIGGSSDSPLPYTFPPLPAAHLGVDGSWHRDGAGCAGGAGEIADPAAVSGPRLCRQNCRCALRRQCSHRRLDRSACIRPPPDGWLVRRIRPPAARRVSVEQPVRVAAYSAT